MKPLDLTTNLTKLTTTLEMKIGEIRLGEILQDKWSSFFIK